MNDRPVILKPFDQLRKDMLGGVYFALGISLIAIVIVAAAGIADLFGVVRADDWSSVAFGLPLVFAGYFAGGVIGGFAFWALRPLRDSLLGWALTGGVIGTIAYGAVGLSGVLGYLYFGVNLFDFESGADAWHSLPWVSLGCGLLVGVPVGIYYWNKDDD